ncbi:cysteine protease StiP domain-containing protein, partial [Acinetobacter baumannii]
IIAKHGHDSIVFVDGWTGKGAIRQELQRSLSNDSRFNGKPIPLVVLSDIAGCAWLAASGEDWLIPSGILGSTVSGLISRSICEGEVLSAKEL